MKLYISEKPDMSIAEQIYALVKSLPQEQASEVLTFAEFVYARHLKVDRSNHSENLASWSELVYSLTGVWGEGFPTLEEIRAEAGEDVLRESF